VPRTAQRDGLTDRQTDDSMMPTADHAVCVTVCLAKNHINALTLLVGHHDPWPVINFILTIHRYPAR